MQMTPCTGPTDMYFTNTDDVFTSKNNRNQMTDFEKELNMETVALGWKYI